MVVVIFALIGVEIGYHGTNLDLVQLVDKTFLESIRLLVTKFLRSTQEVVTQAAFPMLKGAQIGSVLDNLQEYQYRVELDMSFLLTSIKIYMHE